MDTRGGCGFYENSGDSRGGRRGSNKRNRRWEGGYEKR
jgi:hypothetical protein